MIIADWLSQETTTNLTEEYQWHYEHSFLDSLESALPYIEANNIKLIINAGASDTTKLHSRIHDILRKKGIHLRVAHISGDDVLSLVKQALKSKSSEFESLNTDLPFADQQYEPIYARASLGGQGVATAFQTGADIIVCGGFSDSSSVIGAAIWWHGWQRTQLDQLANASIAGHLIECGGNLTESKTFEDKDKSNIGFPIAELSHDGQVVITKSQGSSGEVNIDTCTSQLLSNLQGPWYFNSDVTAILDNVWFSAITSDRVALHGIKSSLPPSSTSVHIIAKTSYQSEYQFHLLGLDIPAKARILEAMIRHSLAPHKHLFSSLTFSLLGSSPDNPSSQASATVTLRVIVQAALKSSISPNHFDFPCLSAINQSPFRPSYLKIPLHPLLTHTFTSLPQSSIPHTSHVPFTHPTSVTIPPPSTTQTYPRQPTCSHTTHTAPALKARGGLTDAAGGWAELPALPGRHTLRETFGSYGRTVRGPLGWIARTRSGQASVGVWVSGAQKEAYDWLRGLLSTRRISELLDGYVGEVERCEFVGLQAVCFVLKGTASTDERGVAEFLRARWVDLPVKFLEKGRL